MPAPVARALLQRRMENGDTVAQTVLRELAWRVQLGITTLTEPRQITRLVGVALAAERLLTVDNEIHLDHVLHHHATVRGEGTPLHPRELVLAIGAAGQDVGAACSAAFNQICTPAVARPGAGARAPPCCRAGATSGW